MRFLGVGDSADLAAIYLRLVEDRHDVKVFIGNPLCQDTLAGLVDRVTDWRAELDWVRSAGTEGCILFENVGAGRGELQDRLRRDGFNVIAAVPMAPALRTIALMPSGYSLISVCRPLTHSSFPIQPQLSGSSMSVPPVTS